jgi:AraC family transcriptional regulator
MNILRHGEFFGPNFAEQRVGGFVVSLTDYAGGTSIPWHRHAEACLTFVLAGGYRERLRQSARQCDVDNLVLHEPGELHADDFTAPSRCLGIYFDPRRVGTSIERSGIVKSPAVAAIATRAARELRHADAMTPIVVEGLMLQLFGDLGRKRESGAAPPWLARVRDEIAARFREPLTTTALAAGAGVHPVHLARSFAKHFRQTIGETIRELRVDFAKSAIRGGRPLSDVAVEAGFADQSHLTRTFRSVTGTTPAKFRRDQRR